MNPRESIREQMTHEEIIRNYRQAKNKKRQIQILADMNHTTKQAIRELLREAGVPLPAPGPQPPVSSGPPVSSPQIGTNTALTRSVHLIELVERGTSAAEIAEVLGVSYGQALTWVARLCVLCEEYIAATEGDVPV